MLARHKNLEVLATEVGVKESGSNNRGPRVEEYQRADGLTNPDVGYPWCMALMQWSWRKVTGKWLANGTASVGQFVAWARQLGYIVERPLRGDHVCFHFNSDQWADHVGVVDKVVGLGPLISLITIEGNTGPTGSVSDPGTGADGVYRKRRIVRRSKLVFIRVPGDVPAPVKPKPKPRPKPAKPKVRTFDVYADGELALKDEPSRRKAFDYALHASLYHRTVSVTKKFK